MTAVFVMLPYKSHYLASFGFARMWQQLGYKTIFTGQASHQLLIETEGFIFYELEYTTSYSIWSFRIFMGLWLKSLLNTNDLRQRYRCWYNSLLAFKSFIKAANPSIIFLDDHLGYYYTYLLPTQTPIVVLNTKLSTTRRSNIPPLNSSLIPTFTFVSKFLCWLLWEKHLAKRRWQDLINKCAFNGKSNDYFQERLANKQNLKSSYYLSNDNCFYKGLRNVPVVLLAPQLLEYNRYNKYSNEFFINPPFIRQESVYHSENYRSLKKELQIRQKKEQIQVVYAAFGTLMAENANNIRVFLPKLIKAVSSRKDWILILSASTEHFPLNLDTVPNVYMIPFIPQLDILTWCDAVVTHGGLTTIKECLQNGVPMLVYPTNKRMDMMGNAARVASNKWGLMGLIEQDSPTHIYRKLLEVLELEITPHQPDMHLPSTFLNRLNIQTTNS